MLNKIYQQQRMNFRFDKISVKNEMFKEISNCEKRYKDLQENYAAAKKKLHVSLQGEEIKLTGLHEEHQMDFEKAEELIADYEKACRRIQELKALAAAREIEAEQKMNLIKINLEKRVQQAARDYKDLEEKYTALRTVSNENMNYLCQEVDLVKGHSIERLHTQQSLINNLELRLNKSEETLTDVTKIAADSISKLKGTESELVVVFECLGETFKRFAKQNERIAELERESQEKHKIVENLESQVQEIKIKSEAREDKVTELEDVIKTNSEENIEKMEMMQKRLDSVEMASRLNILEKEKMVQMLNDRDLMIEHLKEELEVIKTSQAKTEKINRDTLDKIAKSKLDRDLMQQKLESRDLLLRKILPKVRTSLQEIRFDMENIRSQVQNIPFHVDDYFRGPLNKMRERLTRTNEMYSTMLQRCNKEMRMRQKLHKELIQLRGNIRVFVRLRPPVPSDPLPLSSIINHDSKDSSIVHVNNHRGRNLKYKVDHVFKPQSTQEEVYKEVKSLVTSCMDGFYVCIFAYGQTGSGKTYTMEGTEENPGINQRALCDMFSTIEQRSYQWDYQVTVSSLEIYNETLRDLLKTSSEKLDIRMNQDKTLKVSPLEARVVKNISEVNEVLKAGRKNRATDCTNMNAQSSRSHGVLIINVTASHKTDGRKVLGRLNLVDLAGSERVSRSGAAGDRLKEAQNINRSLSALGDVIQAIQNKQPHIPFRNSKLTYLLQDSLSKNSRTLMVVQVSPNSCNATETVCSLAFAQRVRLWNWMSQ